MFGRKKTAAPSRRLADREPHVRVQTSTSEWRRNRTLSGIRRDKLAEAASPRAKVHDLTKRRRKVGGIFLLVLAGCALLALIITQLTARVIVASSTTALNAPLDSAHYEKLINDYLGINPAGRLRFILNQTELSAYGATMSPEIRSIKQSGSDNITDTHFAITFRKPIAGWQINGRQFYVDDEGVVFDKNYFETPTVQIIDESGVSPEQGTTVASSRLLSFVGRVVALAKSGGVEVVEVILPSGTTRQIDVKLKDIQPRVKLSIDRGAGEQVEDMTRALTFLTSRGQVPQYIDVRVAGRAVYS